eukprot:TRINITY_DN44327_c0_g1_i1.p1 TRINITY_DN44327_c0_g1~~TRINITY_DN44327_c0_g1_i1.p1  ORF type:complete len:160 (+),score=19.64 TRINITY_DN44327_c0_g1_i1:30-509(+)
MSAIAQRRLVAEFRDVSGQAAALGYEARFGTTDAGDDNMFQWFVTINGPVGSPYEGGRYVVCVTFPKEYPMKAPEFMFTPNVPLHPAVTKEGFVGCPVYDAGKYKAGERMVSVLTRIVQHMQNPAPGDASNDVVGAMMKDDPAKFLDAARATTRMHFAS